ncbi:MAG: hypothetical protein EOM10_08615, partial [Opitutae bacterium]|nr:hypothetical protein [Opitutae bacterium]
MKTTLSAMKEPRMEWTTLGRAMGAACLILLLAGCATGPKYKVPAPPADAGYTASAYPVRTASSPTALGGEQRFAEGVLIETQWWQAFESSKLDALIEQA